MKYHINVENLNNLFITAQNDTEMLSFLYDCHKSFSDYHQAIFKSESWRRLYNEKNTPTKDYQEKVRAFEDSRTSCHNAVLSYMNALNRMAGSLDIPAIYDGTISEDKPYRRQVADAVLAYVESIIIERR